MAEMKLTEKTTVEKAYKVLAFILGAIFIYSFTTDLKWTKLILGIIFIYMGGVTRDIVVKPKGVEYIHSYFKWKRTEIVEFDKIDEVVIVKDRRNNLAYFVKGNTTKRLSLPESKLDEMVDFIKEHSKVHIRFENIK